jgi:hypothetical protein
MWLRCIRRPRRWILLSAVVWLAFPSFARFGAALGQTGQDVPPSGLRLVEVDRSLATVAWTLPRGAGAFRLERRLLPSGGWVHVVELTDGQSEYTDSGPEPGASYAYRITAFRQTLGPTVSGDQAAARLSVPVAGASEVALIAEDAGDGNGNDHAIWCSPTLLLSDDTDLPLAFLDPVAAHVGWGEPREPEARTVGGQVYEQSVWAHAPSRIRYELPPEAQRLETAVGIDDSRGDQGSVQFIIELIFTDPPNEDLTVTMKDWFRSPGDTTYYVDAERGSDANTGTSEADAWRTLDRVNDTVFARGDQLFFRAGTRYSGQLVLRGSGADGRPIVLRKYGDGPRPRIDAEGRFPEALLLRSAEYWEIADLEITNTARSRSPHRTGVLIEARDFGTAHHIHLNNLFVHDVNSALRKDQGGAGIRWVNGGQQVKSRFDDLRIENCHLLRTDRNGIVGWSEHWNREDWHPSLNVAIRNNLLEDIGGDGIVPIGCDGALIEHNVIRGGRTRCPDYAAGIWPWSCDNTVIQFNEVSGMKGTKDGQGFDSDWNCQNTLIQYNYSHDNEGGFLLICNNGDFGGPDNVGNIGTVVRYNISQNDGARTFQISAVKNTKIYNNTIYVGEGLSVKAALFHSWGGWAEHTHFVNNIFVADGAMSYEFGNTSGTMFSNNVFVGNHVGRPADPEAILADPEFTDPGIGRDGRDSLGGYTLRAGSPCLGAGLPLPGNGGRDFWGNAVPAAAAPDIGAHQFSKPDS